MLHAGKLVLGLEFHLKEKRKYLIKNRAIGLHRTVDRIRRRRKACRGQPIDDPRHRQPKE